MSSPTVIVKFPNLTVNVAELQRLGGIPPRVLFEIHKDGDKYYCYYTEADENFEGKTIKEVVSKIVKFQRCDASVSKVGRPVIETIETKEE